MNLESLAQLGEFLGGIVVILSLIYLAYQIRQNTQSLQAENYGRALDRVAAIQSRLSGDPELARIIGRGALDTRELTAKERIRFTWTLYELFGAYEFMFHQSQKRALPSEMWDRWSASLSWWLSFPGVVDWWRSKPAPFSASFSSLVDARIEVNPVDAAAAARFQEFVRGTQPVGDNG